MGLLDKIMGKFAKKAAKNMQKEQERKLSLQDQIAEDKEKIDALKVALVEARATAERVRPTPEMHAKVARLERQILEMAQKLRESDAQALTRMKKVSLGNKLLPLGFIAFLIFIFGSTALVYKISNKQAN